MNLFDEFVEYLGKKEDISEKFKGELKQKFINAQNDAFDRGVESIEKRWEKEWKALADSPTGFIKAIKVYRDRYPIGDEHRVGLKEAHDAVIAYRNESLEKKAEYYA